MVVTFLSRGDAANLSYNLSESLRSVGIDSIALKYQYWIEYEEELFLRNFEK